MRVLARLRLPPHTDRHAWLDVDTVPGCPGARAPSKTPVDCHLDGETLSSQTIAARIALWAWSNSVLVTGICGSASTAYQPAFFSWNQCRTRWPLAAPTVVVTWSTKWRNLWPSANTRKPLRWRAL